MLTKYSSLFFILVIFTLTSEAFTQTSPQIRRLPPSLERELKLRKGGKVRIIGFVDTLRAQSLIAQSIRDSSTEELDSMSVRDTAIIMIDSSVSLTDKEWLDSMLAELPEYRMTPQGIRFEYPAEILIETTRKVVPPDTTLTSKMDPVTKEDLPLYDAMPMPRPLEQLDLPRTSIELGAGAPYLPRVEIKSLLISNQQTSLTVDGKYRLTEASEPAIKQFLIYGVHGEFAFPNSELPISEAVPELDINVFSSSVKRRAPTQIGYADHTIYRTEFGTDFSIGTPSQLKLQAQASLYLLNDDTTAAMGQSPSENQGNIGLSLLKDIGTSSYSLKFAVQYVAATAMTGAGIDATPNFLQTQLILQQKENEPFQWRAGLLYLTGSDAGGNVSQFSPIVNMKLNLSHYFELGAGFEPAPQLIGLRELVNLNLFYSPTFAALALPNNGQYPGDMRRIVTEPIHLNIFANYFLSLDDEIHAQFHFIERSNEPTFYSDSDIKGHTLFIATPLNTKRVELEFGGSILLFAKDRLKASLLFRSATALADEPHFAYGKALPFEPTVQLQGIYQFGFSDKLIPQIEIIDLQRPDHSFAFINCEARYLFSQTFQLKLRAENIVGSTGDFWTGYNEYPQSVWISAKYSF